MTQRKFKIFLYNKCVGERHFVRSVDLTPNFYKKIEPSPFSSLSLSDGLLQQPTFTVLFLIFLKEGRGARHGGPPPGAKNLGTGYFS